MRVCTSVPTWQISVTVSSVVLSTVMTSTISLVISSGMIWNKNESCSDLVTGLFVWLITGNPDHLNVTR